jgi:outer membrane protein OmpA-like peptidoglycan-associated protein
VLLAVAFQTALTAAAAPPAAASGRLPHPRTPLTLTARSALARPKILPLETAVLAITAVSEDRDGQERRAGTSAGVAVTLQAADVLFPKDSARLGPVTAFHLTSRADEITRRHPSHIRVLGFTDGLDTAAYGERLSQQRAKAVADAPQRHVRDRSVHFEVRGLGERLFLRPASAVLEAIGRRRVEITIPQTRTETAHRRSHHSG